MKVQTAVIMSVWSSFMMVHPIEAQKTVGLVINNDAKAWPGYTLIAPKHYTSTYLINNQGRIINSWTGCLYEPGQSVYLLENGHLLRSCMVKGKLNSGGGEGGRIEEYDWNSNLVWQLDFSTDQYMQHHDIRPLPNGNIIMLVVEKKTYAQVLAAGFDPAMLHPDIKTKDIFLPDYVAEIKPTYPVGGQVVWEWHVWDHLIQDHDASKANYGVVKDHPELISVDGDQQQLPIFWNHMNSIDYNPELEQIALSVRGNSEVWIIDHGTTMAESKGHTGGRRGKGGDLLYRWGNPRAYDTGTVQEQKLYQQHDAEWIRPGCPGYGDITTFNNGLGRNYSTIDEFTPPVDVNGSYLRVNGLAYRPTDMAWSYKANPPSDLYSEAISGAQRLPNGNTLICDGVHGIFLEVTYAGETVWKYINPVVQTGPLGQGMPIPDDPARAGEKMNAVFRVNRYATDYAAFIGRTLTPGSTIESYPSGIEEIKNALPSGFDLEPNYPNPFNPRTTIAYQMTDPGQVSLAIYDVRGHLVAQLVDGYQTAGTHRVQWDAATLSPPPASGLFLYRLRYNGQELIRKMTLLK